MNVIIDGDDDELPDAGEGMCCYGASAMGPGRCTCWKPDYDLEQQSIQAGPPAIRSEMCVDCAFRKDSPERSGDQRYHNSHEGAVENLTKVFYCHQGMRRKLELVHPAGVRVDAGPAAYDPPQASSCPRKADGSPADICAGFARQIDARKREA